MVRYEQQQQQQQQQQYTSTTQNTRTNVAAEIAEEEEARGMMQSQQSQQSQQRRRFSTAVIMIVMMLIGVALNRLPKHDPRNDLMHRRRYHDRTLANEDDAAQDDFQEDDYYEGDDDGVQQQRQQVDDDDNAQEEEEEEEEEEEDEKEDEKDERDKQNGLEFDDLVYIDDDYVDDYYAYIEDEGRPRLIPLSIYDIAGFLFASMGVTLAAGGGIGGGGIVVPVYIVVMQFSPRDAIPLASVTVLGGAIAALCINAHKRHPLADRPLIDWNLVLVMEPLVLTGALVGSVLNRVLSEKLLVVLLVAMLSVTAHTTLAKARRMYAAETIYIEKLKRFHRKYPAAPWRPRYHPPMTPSDSPTDKVPPKQGKYSASSESSPTDKPTATFDPPTVYNDDVDSIPKAMEQSEREEEEVESGGIEPQYVRQEIMIMNPDFVSLRSDMLEEEKVTPKEKIIAICSMFSVLIFLNIMVGGGGFMSPWGIRCGGVAFWVVHVIMGAFLVASAWAAQTYLMNRHEIKQLVAFDYVHGDIRWDSRSAVLYPLIFCAAGLFAGVFGIGGGMICVPLLLTMGVHPQVATATSSCMILFTAFSSVTSFAIFDIILWDYAVVCLLIGFFPTLFGQLLMRKARKADGTFERNSIIAFSIGGVILLSALLMTIQYVLSIFQFTKSSNDEGGICVGYGRGV